MIREYTHPNVLAAGVAEGWAEKETDPTRIDWPVRQKSALFWFDVVDGRPVNPAGPTGIARGRNKMGLWGENPMADALVTCRFGGVRHVLLVQRDDNGDYAAPGGSIERGETPVRAALRELEEETCLKITLGAHSRVVLAAWPPWLPEDERRSDEAWPASKPFLISLGSVSVMPAVRGKDDARFAAWFPAGNYAQLESSLEHYDGKVWTAHVPMLRALLDSTGPLHGIADGAAR